MNIKSINLLLFDVISSVGSKIFSFACAFYILHTTQTSAMYSIFLALIVISTVLSQPIFGVLTDKYNNNNSMFSDFKEGLAYLLRNNTFIRFMMIGVILNFLVNAVIVGVPVISIQTWHISSEQFGIVESATTIGMFSMSLLLSVFPIKKKLKGPFQISMLLMFFSILFLGVSLLIQPNPFQGFIILFLVYLINGIALPLTNIPYSIFLQTYIDENYKGRVLSLNQSIVLCITPLSLLIFGFLLNYTQAGLFIAIAVFVFIILCYFTVAFKKDENLQ